jgi:hypothetical protein
MPDKDGGGGKKNTGDYYELTPSNPDYLEILSEVGGYSKQSWYDSTLTGLADAVLIGGVTALTVGAGAAAGLGAIGAAAAGGATSAAVSDEVHGTPLTLGSVAAGAATGAVTQGLNQAGVNPIVSAAVVGGTKAGLTGGDVLTGAETGAIGGVIQQGITSSGLGSAINDTIGSTAGNIATKVIGGELTSLATNALTSGSKSSGGKVSTPPDQLGTVTTTPSTSGGTGTDTPSTSDGTGTSTPPASTDSSGGLLSSLGSVLPSASTLKNAAPYAAAAAIGTYEASRGRANDQKYVNQLTALGNQDINASKQMYGNYINNKLNPQDQALLNNANKTVSDIAANSAGLSSIAKAAFTNYENGVLPAWQQAQLDAQTEAQKQQVAQQLSSAGISDSTILASAYANIDNQASITKGQLLQQNFSTGTAAYDEFLKGTQEGNSILETATKTADTTLNSELQAALSAFGTGSGIVQSAIDTAMKTDQQYSAELASLYATLTAAYAKQYQTTTSNGGGSKSPSVSVGGKSSAGSGGGGGSPASPNSSDIVNNDVSQNLDPNMPTIPITDPGYTTVDTGPPVTDFGGGNDYGLNSSDYAPDLSTIGGP